MIHRSIRGLDVLRLTEIETPMPFSIVHTLLDLLLLITNWSCDVDICVEHSIDSDSEWITALITVYPLRVALYQFNREIRSSNPLGLHTPIGSETVLVKLYSDYLKREVMSDAFRLHVATEFFPFGHNPHGGPMHSVAQHFRACSYYNRHFPEMCAYLGAEFPPCPTSLKTQQQRL